MNEKVEKKIQLLFDAPKYIEDFSHNTDAYRVYNLAITIYENSANIEEVIEEIEKKFYSEYQYGEQLVDKCRILLTTICDFLQYIEYGKK